jgi:hypothetical protein
MEGKPPGNEKAVARFLAKVEKRPDGCWLYAGWKDKDGYASFWLNGRNVRAHRAAMLLLMGHRESALLVLHSCDHPWCVNPEHLSFGTQKENIQQAIHRGRRERVRPPIRRGEKNNLAKLTEDQVRDLRARYAAGGITQAALASAFGICHGTAKCILRRETWAWLT